MSSYCRMIGINNQHSLSEGDIYELLNALATQTAYRGALSAHFSKHGISVHPDRLEGQHSDCFLINPGSIEGVAV